MSMTAAEALKRDNPKRPFRSSFQKGVDRGAQIERWKVEGHTEREIVELLAAQRNYRLSRAQIHMDVAFVEDEWRRRAAEDIASAKGKELAGLRLQEAELWSAWEKSKLDAETIRQKVTAQGADKLTPAEITKTKEGQCGNPANMRLLLEVRQRRSKLLGAGQARQGGRNDGGRGHQIRGQAAARRTAVRAETHIGTRRPS